MQRIQLMGPYDLSPHPSGGGSDFIHQWNWNATDQYTQTPSPTPGTTSTCNAPDVMSELGCLTPVVRTTQGVNEYSSCPPGSTPYNDRYCLKNTTAAKQCWDGSTVPYQAECPPRPLIAPVPLPPSPPAPLPPPVELCWDGSTATAGCPPIPEALPYPPNPNQPPGLEIKVTPPLAPPSPSIFSKIPKWGLWLGGASVALGAVALIAKHLKR